MRLAQAGEGQIRRSLRHEGLVLKTPPFVARLQSDIPRVTHDLVRLYPEFELGEADGFADFHLQVNYVSGLRRFVKPTARFASDGESAFSSLPADQCFHMMEWGLNWAVTSSAHRFLIYHAAVLEKNGRAVMLPAPPGSGKSTLTAALANRGWRLLSDELALYNPLTGQVHGMARPVNLKNTAIDLIQRFAPQAIMTDPVPDTLKGTLALMRPSTESVTRVWEPAPPAWIVAPRYVADSPARLQPMAKASMLLLLAEQAFNYDIHGRAGFTATAELVEGCRCFEFTYGLLDDAIRIFDALAAGTA